MRDFNRIRLKYIANIYTGNSISDDLKDRFTNKSIPYIPTKELDATTGIINYDNGLSVSEDDGFKLAPPFSTLMCIEGGSAGKKIGLTDRKVAFVNKLCCIDSRELNKRLLYYCLQSKDFTEQFFLNMTGLIGGVSVSVLKNLYITININSEIQEKIADKIYFESCKINSLIANQEAQIEKLKQYKQSLITEVVTKGLNPDVEMKDSGVEWIGEIPNHWSITRIKNLFELRNERNFKPLEEVNLISLYTEQGVIQHSDITETAGNKAVNADGYKLVYEDDIVVNIILCWMGAVGRSAYNGVTSPAYDVYKPLKDTYSRYFHYLFRTLRFNGECYRYGRGIMMMRWRTYSSEFRAINVPFPTIEEQKEIVAYLDEQCAKIDKLIEIKRSKIAKLNEYKKSLIYEYVTGKKEA